MSMYEVLSPAGNLEKLKVAILYGADAVFIGGKKFSLRSMASNFTLEDIREGCAFAHAHNAKIHVTCNIVMHESDTEGLLEYLKDLEACGVDAIICSSVYILKMVKKYTKMEAHVSTQQSSANEESVRLFRSMGADRVVLARELSIEEIAHIRNAVKDIDIECFIHGGMCASYSGRCMLSNIMTNRDANRGGCAHSCRWNYDLYEDGEKINPDGDFYSMSSKDFCALRAIPSLMDIGVNSFKIEGRMKSIHYIANVVSAYRQIVDEYKAKGRVESFEKYEDYIRTAMNRKASTGFLFNRPTLDQQLYDLNKTPPNQEFVGVIRGYDPITHMADVEERNFFSPNADYEILTPHGVYPIHIDEIFDADGNVLDAARHPKQALKIRIDVPVEEYDIIR